jgi:hypothetical protein
MWLCFAQFAALGLAIFYPRSPSIDGSEFHGREIALTEKSKNPVNPLLQGPDLWGAYERGLVPATRCEVFDKIKRLKTLVYPTDFK